MPLDKPWSWLAPFEPDRAYVVVATDLPVERWAQMPTACRHIAATVRQLTHADGLVGYALRTAPHRRRFWTLSVWRDETAVRDYVGGQPHRDAMRWLPGSGTNFTARWTTDGGAEPPSWTDALARLERAMPSG